MPVIDNAVYTSGLRTQDPRDLEETFELMRARRGMAWIGLYRPDHDEFHRVADEFELDEQQVQEALCAHPRPRAERRGHVLFTVLRTAQYIRETERVEFGEVQVFTGPNFVVTVRHAEAPDLAEVRRRLERSPELLALGPLSVLCAVIAQVVDDYAPVVAGLEDDIDEIEDQLFAGDPAVSRRIYELSREAIRFQRATQPLGDLLDQLNLTSDDGRVPDVLRERLAEVRTHSLRIAERADSFRALLQNALTTHATLVGQQQSEEMRRLTEASLDQNEQMRILSAASLAQNEVVKKISSWAAIFFVPTLIGTIYGMNFEVMPELTWTYGYPLALAAMASTGAGFYLVFRRQRWL